MKGEKWGFHRTDVMREFPLPEIEGYTGLVPSSVAWNAIARKYKTRYVNETLKTWSQDQPTSLSRPANELVFVPGELIATRDMLNHNLRWLRYDPWTFYIYSVFYTRNALALRLVADGTGLHADQRCRPPALAGGHPGGIHRSFLPSDTEWRSSCPGQDSAGAR